MRGNTDKAAGVANKAIGKAKQSVGIAVGSDKLKGEGRLKNSKSNVQKAGGEERCKESRRRDG